MASRDRRRRHPAHRHCAKFERSTLLIGCSRGGLEALERDHRRLVVGDAAVGCSIDLDACLRSAEPDAHRWDYVLVLRRDDQPGVAMEVHHAASKEVEVLIEKKAWASELLERETPTLDVRSWHWIIPPDSDALFTRQSPEARRLAEHGIEFPRAQLVLSPQG